ncbi:MAG TPA: hypothetical protein VJ598_00640 [Albitalea sp.]|nr:hypothetical protein [Albitalea sp.]
MNTSPYRIQLSRLAGALLTLGVALGSSAALAADKTGALERYQQERAVCLSGQSNQDRATCLKEATNAYDQAKHGGLDNGPVPYQLNQLKRCERLPDEDRRDCVARMEGQGTTSGSVSAGGIYRELVTREVGEPPAAEPAPDSPAKGAPNQ